MLYRGAKILILDEPTAVLVPQEVDELFDNLRELKSEGLTVIFISHKLDEVLEVADEITVIRRGTTVATVDPNERHRPPAGRADGRQRAADARRPASPPSPTEVGAQRARASPSRSADGRALLEDVTFTIHRGEVLGIAGVEGNGQAELVEAIMGMRPLESGTITLGGTDITDWTTRRRREAGIGYIPEDRHRHGLLLDAPLWENRILGHQTEAPERQGSAGSTGRGARKDTAADRRRSTTSARPASTSSRPSLSGGNQQKLIVGREMSGEPKVLIAAHPTRGVDVGAQAAIWDHIREARRDGLAVLLISADLDELIGLSDTHQGDPARPVRRRRRPGDGHAGGARVGDDRRRASKRGMRRASTCAGSCSRVAAPLLAIAFALLVTALVLLATGDPVCEHGRSRSGTTAPSAAVIAQILNRRTVYYLSALAVAIGFRMNLFNIGVDGQYRLAAFTAAVVGGAGRRCPSRCTSSVIVLVAMLVGAMWAGIAAVLKVTRGVSEVISTIMLNSIATALIAYLLRQVDGRRRRAATTSAPSRSPSPAPFPGIPLIPGSPLDVYGFIVVAVLAGVAYSFVLGRTRFGFDLRATGRSESAAVASGVNVKRMVVITMLLSGAVAGLVGMPQLLGGDSRRTAWTSRPASASPASRSRCSAATTPIGMALGALLCAFLDSLVDHPATSTTSRRRSS